ncbi:MAG: T9SS type A sorting domain-containing protein [Ignavibacteria bacterium]|nr:T9SS type A sorting domain-containing protein [Ignavibacteria bacterium]
MKLLLLTLLIIISSLSVFGQGTAPTQITVGKTPTFVTGFYDFQKHDYFIYVISLGYDQDFNRKEDPGDEKPAIYYTSYTQVLAGKFTANKLIDLPFGTLPFPTRIAFDNVQKTIFTPGPNNTIEKYSLQSGEKLKTYEPFKNLTLPADIYISSIYYKNNKLFISVVSETSEDMHQLFIYDENSESLIFDTKTEPYPIQSLVIGNHLFILCSGLSNSNNSKLWIYSINFNPFEMLFLKELDLGDTGNHLSSFNDSLLVITMNGTHQVHLVDLANLNIVRTIQFPTTDWNGPRESVEFRKSAIVTTAYDGNLYIHSLDGNLLSKVNLGNKLEGIFAYSFESQMINFNFAIVTSPFLANYQPNDKVIAFLNFSNVDNSVANKISYAFPNPSIDYIKIKIQDEQADINSIEIVDMMGNIVAKYTFTIFGSEIMLPTNELPNGTHFARIISNSKIIDVVPFVVNR